MESFLLMWFCQASSATTYRRTISNRVPSSPQTHHNHEARKSYLIYGYLVGPAVGVFQLNVRLLPDAVQIFVKSVQQEGQQLVRVLLLITRKLRSKPTHLSLQEHRQIFRCEETS